MKKEFEVQDNETIADCLDRMKDEGYVPVKRMEKPIFEEVQEKGEKKYVPIKQKIVFQGIKMS